MYAFIEGILENVNPATVVINNRGIGYIVNISLNTFSAIKDLKECKLYIHQVVREDALILFGFHNEDEKVVFQQLITVSGVGPNTARLILSSLTSNEVIEAINIEDITRLKSVKGIGAKTASRIVIDLKGKIGKGEISDGFITSKSNPNRSEAVAALVMLGFNKNIAEKAIEKVIKEQGVDLPVDVLIKNTLQYL